MLPINHCNLLFPKLVETLENNIFSINTCRLLIPKIAMILLGSSIFAFLSNHSMNQNNRGTLKILVTIKAAIFVCVPTLALEIIPKLVACITKTTST